MSEFDDFAARLGTSSDVSLQQSSPLSEDTQLSADQERIKRRTEAFNDIALQATRDSLGKVSNPIERKRLDAYYSLEQKQKFLEDNTIDKYHGLDGFQRMRIRKASDGDSGWIEDKNGNRYEFRLNSSSSTNIDTPDLLKSVQASSYKSRIQPEAVARASGKSVDQLTEFDYANYDHYAQNEFIKRITSKEGYKSERYDPSKVYSPINADGLEVYARFEGEDSTSSKRKLTTILNPYTGENVGYNSSLDPNVNADFSLFRSLRTRSNAQKALAAQRRGEYYRDTEMPENGYVDPNASMKRYYEEYGDRTPLDSFIGGYARQLGSAALSSAGNIAVALNDTLGGSEESKGIFDLRRFADKDVANIAVGMRKERRDAYNKYIQNVSSKFEEGNIAGGLWEFIKNPAQVSMFVAEQLGNMAPGIAATVATGGAGAASFGAATATDLLANIGMDFMEFRKNHGRSMDTSEMAKAYIRQLPAAVMDALSDKILVGNSNVFKTARYTPLRAAGEVAKEMGVEGTQEVVQNIASQMNAEDKSFAEAATDPSNISNFMLGALGGGLMSAPVGSGQVYRHMVKQANYQRIREQYGEDYDNTTYHDGDTLREDHRAVRENLISSTRDSFDKAKESTDISGMISNIGTLNNEIKNTQSGLSKRDVDHMRSSLYDMISDMVATAAANGMLSEDLNNVLQQLQDSLGVKNNEQLKKELARYAEVYGSAAVGDKEGKTDEVFSRRNLASSDYYENASDVESRAQRFEDLIQNLGGTKAEARKLLEEVAEENINDKNEGFNSSLAKAKEAQEKGDTETYNNEVNHMTGRLQSMVMKMQEITDGLRSNMNKGATTDSRGFLSDDKFTILYGNEKDSSRRGEKAQFRTSFKKEAFNYSTRGGLFRTTDQIASEARYMAEQLNSLDISDEQKSAIKQQLDLLQEYENDINHMGYELHRGIRGGFNYEADTDGEAILSEGEKAKIKGAMEDYFHQYVTPNTGEKSLSQKEAVDLKKYINTLSLGQLKAFQKSLDPKEDSIAYEGVSSVIKARESARGIATSHAQWRGTHYQNGKYIRSLVQTTQTTEKGNEAKIDNMVNGTHVDAINNANILEAHYEQLQQRIAKLEVKKNRTKREEKKLNDLKARLNSTKERLDTLEKVSDAGAKTIYRQYASKILDHPAQLSNLIAKVYKANIEQDAKVNVRAYEKAIKMLRDTLHDAASMETDKAKLKEAKKALEILNNVLKRAKKSINALEGRDTTINNLINICSKENLRKLSDIDFLKALKQSMEKFKTMLGDRLNAYKGPYKEALYNLAYKIRLIERNDEDLARSILYDIKHNGDLNDLKARAAQYEKKIAELQSKKSLSVDGQKMLDRYKQYSSAISKQAKKLEDRANEFENKLPDRPDIFAVDDIDELENIDRTLVNSLSQLYDPKSEFYGNKLAVQKVMEIRKDIRDRIAELSEKQDASESPQNGSESTETGQGEQSTTETQEGSQNGSEGANSGSQVMSSEEFAKAYPEEIHTGILKALQQLYAEQRTEIGDANFASYIDRFIDRKYRDIITNNFEQNIVPFVESQGYFKYNQALTDEVKHESMYDINLDAIKKINNLDKAPWITKQSNQQESQAEVLNIWLGTGENANLSNLALRPFDYEGRHYQSVEHAYQTLKSGSFDEAIYNDPRWNNEGTKIQGRKGTDKNINLQLMKNLILESFKQNDSAREELLATGNAKFTHKRPKGSNGIWETEFPRILEEVREELKDYQPETDNSEELDINAIEAYSVEDAVSKAIEQYNTFIDPNMSSEEANDIVLKLQNIIDQAIKFPTSPYLVENMSTLQNILGDYKRQYEEALNREAIEFNSEAIEAAPQNEAEALITCNNVLNTYKNIDPNLSSDELYSIANKISETVIKFSRIKNEELQDLLQKLRELYDAYNAAGDEIWDNENNHSIDSDENMSSEDETLEQLKERLINVKKKKTKEEKKAEGPVNPMGEALLSQWRGTRIGNPLTGKPATKKDALLKVFTERERIKRLSSYFRTKIAAMTLDAKDGRNERGLNRLINTAVELLNGAVMQLEEIPEYTSTDKRNKKPNPQTLGTENSKKEFKLLYSWNGVISNMFNSNPHLQLLYAPDVVTGNLRPKNGKPFANVYSAKMNKSVAAAILLAMSEFFANRTVSTMFNPQSRDEIAASFGTTAEAADPMQLDMYSKVVNRWGVFKNSICATLGKLVMDNLGLTRSPELTQKLFGTYENAEAALGNLVLVMAQQLGLIKVTDVYVGPEPTLETAKNEKEYNDEKALYDRCAKLEELGISREEASSLGLGDAKVRHFYKFVDTKENAELIKDLWLGPQLGLDEDGMPIMSGNKIERDESLGFKQFKTGEDTLTRTPKLDPKDVHNKSGRRKQEEFKLTPERMAVLDEESKAPYFINTDILDKLLSFCDGNMTKLRAALLKKMGYNDIITKKKKFKQLSYDEQQKIKGKNENIIRELDYLLDYAKLQKLLKEKGEFKGYFFGYFGSANGRSFMDTNTVNPQTAKSFTRFLMQPITTYQEYELGKREDIEKELFAVAQAFDCLKKYYSTDEYKHHNGASLAGKLLGLDVIGEGEGKGIEAIEERLEELKELQKDLLLSNDSTNKKVYKKLGWNGKVENFGQACVAIDHCIRRLEAILENNGDPNGATVSSYLSVENDSTTSGYVIKFMLMPLDEGLLMNYGPKVGFLNHALIDANNNFSPDFKKRLKEYTSIDQLKADPEFLDIYKTGAVEMISEFNNIEQEIGNKNITIGDYVVEKACEYIDDDGNKTLTRLGYHLENSGMNASSITKGFNVVSAAIPHPTKDKKTGFWTVSSVLRNLMKPIIMIFGYNASNDSCRKRFAEAVMDEHIKDFLKLYHNGGLNINGPEVTVTPKGVALIASDPDNITDEDRNRANAIAKFMFGAAVRVTGLVNNRAQALKEFANQLSDKSPYAVRFLPAKEGVLANETLSLAEWYQLAIGNTYGQAITNFLSNKFKPYGDANKALNNVSKIVFKLYSHVRNQLIHRELAKLAELDDSGPNKAPTDSRIQSLRSKHAKKLNVKEGVPHKKLTVDMLSITDLTVAEVNAINEKVKPLFPMFPVAGLEPSLENKEQYYIRSVETTSVDLTGASAYTEMWQKGSDGKFMPGFSAISEGSKYKKLDPVYDNAYGDVTEFSEGQRILAVLLIHFFDGLLAQNTMSPMLRQRVQKYLTVVHDAFVASAKDSSALGKVFNEELFELTKNFNPFLEINKILGRVDYYGRMSGLVAKAHKICEDEGLEQFDFDSPLTPTQPKVTFNKLVKTMYALGRKTEDLKHKIFSLVNPDGTENKIVVANLGGDIDSGYNVVEKRVRTPVAGTEMASPTIEEKASVQQGDALGSKASAWKDRYDINNIEKEANSSKEGRAKMFNALNEYDKAYGMVENSEEYLNDVQSLLNEINPERFTNLPLETATSKTGTAGKGVYFTGANGGQRRITIIKPSAISSAADQRSRFVSRQTSMAAVYAHELIHPAVGEAIANPDAYGVTREVDILKQFHDDIGKELTPEFFRPSDYDTYTEAEKKLADQSAQETYDYMFNNPDKDTIGGLQEFVAWAVTDPRMREYLKNRQASSYSKEYNGKNTLQKIMYILKHIFKAMFGNTESRKKVMTTLTRVGTESRKQTNTLDAMQKLIVEISYANRYAANKLNNNKLSKLENVFEALGSAMQVIKPVNDFVSDKVKWIFDLGGVSNRFERTYKSLEEIIRAQGITENGSKMDTLKTLLLCPFSHNMRVALTDTLIGCCSLGQRSTFAHLIRDVSDKDDATRQLETLASNRTNIDRMSRGVGAAYSAEILEAFEGKLFEEDSVALTKAGIGCDLQSLLTNGYTVKEIQELASGVGIEEAIKSHELAIAKHYEKAKNGKKMATWTRNQCIGLAHFMNTNKGNPSQCLNAYDIARGFLSSSINDKADEKLVGHIDCLASLYAIWNARPEDRLAISKMNAKGLETVLKCHRDLVSKSFDAGYIERTHIIKGWHSSIIDDTKAYAVAPVDPATRKQMEEDGYKLYNDQALPVDGMTNAILGFYVKDMITPEHRQGAALQITGKRSMGQSLNSFMENNPDIIGDRRDYITKQIKKAHAIRMKMQNTMETEEDLTYEDFTNKGIVGSYYTPIINPKGQVVDFRITMFNDFKDEAMKRDNNVLSVISKMGMTHTVKASAGDQNLNIVHFLVDDMEKNMDPNTHTVRRQYENLGEVILGSQERRNKHDIKYVRLQIDPDSEFIAPDIPAAIVPSEMREAMRKLEKHGDGLWVREDWLYQIFGTPEMSMADMEVFKKENMRAVRNGIRFAEHLIKAIATLAKVAIVFKKPAVIIGNAVSNYLFHLMNGQNPVTAARMDTENLQLIMEYMKMEKDINRLDLKKDIGEATPAEKAQLTRLRAHLEHSPIHELVQAGLFSAVVEDTSKKDQDAIKVMLRKITENEQLKKTAKSVVGDIFDMDTKLGQAAGQLYMREGTPIYDFIYTMTQYSDFVSRATDYRIGMRNMPEKIRSNADLRRKYKKALIEQIRDDYINYDIPQSKLMNYVNAMGYTFFTKYFFRIQRIIRRTTTRRPLMSFAMMAANSRFDMPDNIFEQAPWHKNYGAIVHTPWENATDLLPPPLLNLFGFFG